jgi:hypothetical protein
MIHPYSQFTRDHDISGVIGKTPLRLEEMAILFQGLRRIRASTSPETANLVLIPSKMSKRTCVLNGHIISNSWILNSGQAQ